TPIENAEHRVKRVRRQSIFFGVVRFPFLDEFGEALPAAQRLLLAVGVVRLLVNRRPEPVEDDLRFILAARIDGFPGPVRETLVDPLVLAVPRSVAFGGIAATVGAADVVLLVQTLDVAGPSSWHHDPQSGEFAGAAVGPSIDPLPAEPDRAMTESR